jgi:hypothetical protein
MIGVWIQGFAITGQMLYHLSYAPRSWHCTLTPKQHVISFCFLSLCPLSTPALSIPHPLHPYLIPVGSGDLKDRWVSIPSLMERTMSPAPWGGDTGSHKSATGLINRMLSRSIHISTGPTHQIPALSQGILTSAYTWALHPVVLGASGEYTGQPLRQVPPHLLPIAPLPARSS